MPGTKAGGQLAAQTNKQRHGEDFYRKIGSQGGKASGTGGFYHLKYVKGNFKAIAEYGRQGGLKKASNKKED